MLSGPLLLIAIASPLPNTQTGSYIPKVQTPAICPPISVSERDHQALSAGPGWDRDTNVRERDGNWTETVGSGMGAGELGCGNGRAQDGITCPMQHSSLYMCMCVGVPAMYCLLETVAVSSEYFAPQFAKDLDWIKVLTHY